MVGLRNDCFLKVLDENVDVLVCHRTRQTTRLDVTLEVVINVVIQLCFYTV